MEVKNQINNTVATANRWPRPLNGGGRWIEVSNRGFGKWPLNGGWQLNRGRTTFLCHRASGPIQRDYFWPTNKRIWLAYLSDSSSAITAVQASSQVVSLDLPLQMSLGLSRNTSSPVEGKSVAWRSVRHSKRDYSLGHELKTTKNMMPTINNYLTLLHAKQVDRYPATIHNLHDINVLLPQSRSWKIFA